ncbi:MAG: GAF domain-containing protein, partial [Armatimonadetes bacterium]|nr:GAF domain-containing protein [Armatimonadota bacterium]
GLVVTLNSVWIGHTVVRPVVQLRRGVETVAAGDLDQKVGVTGSDEIGELAAAFNRMTGELKSSVVALEGGLHAREQAETAARREAEFSSAVLGTLGTLVVVMDTEGRIVRFNRTCESVTGYRLEEVEGQPFWDLFLLPEEAPGVRDVWRQLTAGQFPSHHENHWLTREGEARLISWSNTCLTNDEGAVEHVIATGVDVTEQRQAEERIVHLNSVLKAIRSVNQLIQVETDRGRLLQACCETLIGGRGYARAWLVTTGREGEPGELFSQGLGDRLRILEEMIQRQVLPPCAHAAPGDRDVLVWVADANGCAGCPLAGTNPCPTHMTVLLSHEGHDYGLLCVCLPPETEAADEEQALLLELAGDIALGLHMRELAEAESEAQRNLALERDRLAALHRLSDMSEASLNELTDFALEGAVRLTGSTIGYLAFMNEDESVLTMHSWSKSAMAECAIIDKPIVYPVVNTGLWGEAVRQRQPVITNDYQAPNPQKKGCPEGHVHVARHMNIPVFDSERIVAVAGVGNKEEPYDDRDVVQLQLLMQGMWRLIQRRNTLAELQALNEDLEARVETRTAELAETNEQLTSEMAQRTRAQEQTAAERARLFNVLGMLPGYTCLLTPERDLRYVNQGFLDLFGDPGGRKCYQAMFGRREPCPNCRSFEPLTTGESIMWEQTSPAGAVFEMYNSAFTDLDGSQLILEFALDITERHEAQEALSEALADLQRSNAELEQFASVASHDLQEPLRMVSSYVQLLSRRYQGQLDADADEFIGYAVDGAGRMSRLIQDLLTYSRVGTRGRAPEPTDCNAVVQEALGNLQAAIEDSGAQIVCDPLPEVMADGAQLVQLFQNLVANAIKFRGEAPPQVRITAADEGTEWRFCVADNGIGLDMAYAERIFTIFQRLNPREDYPGTGIGLAVCHKIVERHRGRIWVESAPEQGARFTFTLPKERGHDDGPSG